MIGLTLLKIAVTAFVVFILVTLVDMVNGTHHHKTSPMWIALPGGLALLVWILGGAAGIICLMWGV